MQANLTLSTSFVLVLAVDRCALIQLDSRPNTSRRAAVRSVNRSDQT
ncbi:hypothetical protein RESH_02493 [Rhodopirellula europaea SH398]|uniref:Uncharacterized protein n=1 Tax=Rhodopirellula europaea SH398 TaxID=1263868 RepID=M5S638_9BACT|nr:hypothetical protein RESH_02493 [Rhodopirellula europaea SH398]